MAERKAGPSPRTNKSRKNRWGQTTADLERTRNEVGTAAYYEKRKKLAEKQKALKERDKAKREAIKKLPADKRKVAMAKRKKELETRLKNLKQEFSSAKKLTAKSPKRPKRKEGPSPRTKTKKTKRAYWKGPAEVKYAAAGARQGRNAAKAKAAREEAKRVREMLAKKKKRKK